MNFKVPTYIEIGYPLVCLFLFAFLFNHLVKENPQRRSALIGLSFFYLMFFAVLGALVHKGVFYDFSRFPPPIVVPFFILWMASFAFVLARSTWPLFTHFSLPSLVKLQSFRLLAEAFILVMIYEKLMPDLMSIEGRNYDLIPALTAWPLAAVLSASRLSRRTVWLSFFIWNLAAMLILLNTVVTAILAMPTPKQQFVTDIVLVAPATFPAYLLPAFMVTLAFSLHLLIFKKMLKEGLDCVGE